MRKYILLSCVLAAALITLAACQEIGTAGRTEPELLQEAYAYQSIAYEEAVHTSWQEAYAEKLNEYAQHPATTADIVAEWRFMLHDINQYRTPQLFLVRYYDGLVNYHTVYSFEDGNAMMLKSALNMPSLLMGGMYIAPGGTGVIRYISSGDVSHFNKFELSGATLSRTATGDAVPSIDSFRINAFPVTRDEFEYTFGCYDEREWLVLHEITEANIRDIIFGWYPATN